MINVFGNNMYIMATDSKDAAIDACKFYVAHYTALNNVLDDAAVIDKITKAIDTALSGYSTSYAAYDGSDYDAHYVTFDFDPADDPDDPLIP